MKKSKIFYSTYRDSVLLMKMSSALRAIKGVKTAEVMMASESNKSILDGLDLLTDEIKKASNTDLAVSVIADEEQTIELVFEKAEDLILFGEKEEGFSTVHEARLEYPDANIALISIAGAYAADEAERALNDGMNVMLFSDNVEIRDELRVKQLAESKHLIVMGPDCGTAMINGAALAFCNEVQRGSVGIVGASGTGTQEAMVLLDKSGVGISHAIGTGSNDIKESVGGITMLRGIQMLKNNADTELILIIAKPTDASVEKKIYEALEASGKPAVVCLLGGTKEGKVGSIQFASTIEDAVKLVIKETIGQDKQYDIQPNVQTAIAEKRTALQPEQKYIRGLYTGGTLAGEACVILGQKMAIESNIKIRTAALMDDPRAAKGNAIIDLGDDIFTRGKPHPMIEPTLRAERILIEAADPSVAVILLDFVIGYGVHEDPVGCTIPYIQEAKKIAKEQGRELAFVGYVLGTEKDYQNIAEQNAKLESCGAFIANSNAQAVRIAEELIGG